MKNNVNTVITSPKCLVILGKATELERLVHNDGSRSGEWPDFSGYSLVIAADRGQVIAARLGIDPQVVVGDFDSSPRPDAKSPEAEIIVLPREKAFTDSEAAIDLAYKRGFREIDVLGGLSGRFDHTLGNLGVLAKYSARAQLQFFDGLNIVTMLAPGKHLVNPRGYRYLGLIAYGAAVQGLTLRGTKYEVTDFTLPPDTTRGVSNEIISDSASLSFRAGRLLVINSRDAE